MRRIILILACVLACSAVNAEPSAGVKHLMGAPASLFDLGMHKMRVRLSNVASYLTYLNLMNDPEINLNGVITDFDVAYSEDKNEISVDVDFDSNILDPDRETCASLIQLVQAGVFRYIESPFDLTTPILSDWFSHENHTEDNRPEDVGGELRGLMKISASVYVDIPLTRWSHTRTERKWRCSGTLLDPEIVFSET